MAELGLPPDVATRIAASVTLDGPLKDVAELTARAGVAPGDIERLAGLVTALPGTADVNVNAAPTELLAVLLQNRGQARVLAAKRERAGFLTPEDVEAAGLILPAGVGFASSFFRVRTTVRVGGTVQAMESLLQRRRGEGGAEEVAVVRRRNVTAAVPPPPPS